MTFALRLTAGDPRAALASLRAALQGPGAPPEAVASGPAALGGRGAAGPLRLRPDGPILVGEARLADAGRLAGRLGMGAEDHRALVLAAHDRWGADAGAELDGHYALAVWDSGQRLLWAARDPFGVGGLFWRRLGADVVVAGTIEALLGHGVPPPDEAWVAEYLCEQRTGVERTPFEGIHRVAPGHALVAAGSEAPRIVSQRGLWPPVAGPAPPHEAPEALREALDASVARAVAVAPGRVGAMLSGGLDSGSIAVLAARRAPAPLRTYSITYPGRPELDERPWIEETLAAGGRVAPTFLPVEGAAIADQSGRALAGREHPASSYGAGVGAALLGRCAADGCVAILDGHGGDEVVAQGFDLMADLARVPRLWALWRAAAPPGGDGRLDSTLAALAGSGPNRWVRGAARRLRRAPPENRTAWRRMVRADLVARTDLVARARAGEASTPGAPRDAARHLALLSPGALADAAESLERIARPHSVRPLYPFYDERVLAVCLGVPDADRLWRGWPRAHLRHAMAGVLPDRVRWRTAKTDFTPALLAELREDRAGDLAALLRPGSAPEARVAPFVDLPAFRAAAERLRDPSGTPGAIEARQAFRVLALADWLARIDGTGPGA
jgi:asparagine synthase (glutamine-hydrolysing)